MNKKIFLTSAVIMCMACPAIAENFPGDGNMLENKTYDNAATYTNTGVYEGDVTANAYYDLNPYTVAAGSYFTGLDNNNNATTAQCTSGNYCPGVQSTTYDDVNSAFVDDGLQTCPSGYASSDLGASANTQCYRTCDIANMGANGTIANIAHAATLTGNDYYGNGTDTCEPTACVNGWHVKEGIPRLRTLLGDLQIGGTGRIPENGAYVDGAGDFNEDYRVEYGQSFYDISNNEFVVGFGNKGTFRGHGRCSKTSADYLEERESIVDQTGQEGALYCWCHLDSYKPYGGNTQSLSSNWIYFGDNDAPESCVTGCTNSCMYAGLLSGEDREFYAFLDTVKSSSASCEANTINITWNDASAEDIAATGAATTVYEGDIKTPLKAVTKPGKTFVGWKFVKPQQTPVEP